KLIMHTWAVSQDSGNALWTTLGFTFISDDAPPPDPVFFWTPTHPYFTGVPQLTAPINACACASMGQHVQPLAGFSALAGYTVSPSTNNAALIVGNHNRTIFKAFIDLQGGADLDVDNVVDEVELWTNMIC